MYIKQALKLKNKLVQQIAQEFQRMNDNNVHSDQEKPAYDSKESLIKYKALIDELTELKTKIHRANSPVYDKIFKMAELKSAIKSLRRLNCLAQKRKVYSSDADYTNFIAEIGLLERDQLIEKMEAEIETLQEALDVHNNTVQI